MSQPNTSCSHPHCSHNISQTAQVASFLEREASAEYDPVQTFRVLTSVVNEANRQLTTAGSCDVMFLTHLQDK